MIPHKPFKVASISTNPNSFGLYGHILIAEDGEAWQVGRARSGEYPQPWERGEIVQAPLKDDPIRRITAPAWEEMHCEIPERLADAPDSIVAEVWGKPAIALEPAIPPADVTPGIVFAPVQFIATPTATAQEKADFANAFVRFVENNFQERHFSAEFYGRLSLTFGHAAHVNRTTFYRTFFTKAVDRYRFLKLTVEHQPVGDPAATFSDVERVLRDWIIASGKLNQTSKTADHVQNRHEREQLKRLLEKHGLPEDFGSKE